MKTKILSSVLSLFFLTVIFISKDAAAYPKFAALTGEKCQNCHVNPTGGGLRHPGGIKYAKDNLYMKFLEKVNKEAEIETKLTKTIQIGADMRAAFFNNEAGEGNSNFNTFFQMQADLYVNAKINKYLNLMLNPGFDIPNTYGNNHLKTKSEIWGMISNLPAGLYLKAGRFIPNFGIKIAEHRAYNRTFNGFYTPYAADAGLEIGISPSFFTLTASLTNGTSADKNGTTNNSFDFDSQKQVTVSGDFRWASKKNKYVFGIGGSFINNPFKYDPANNINAVRQIGAGFISVGIMERVSLLAEYDYNRLKLGDSVNSKREFSTIFGEVNIILTKGVELKGQVEFYDGALGIKNSINESRRYSFGFVVYPMTGLEIEAIYRLVQEPYTNEDPNYKLKNNEYQSNIKFYF